MKTMEDLYKDVMASEEQKNELSEAAKEKASLESFLKKYECDASADVFKAFLEEKTSDKLNNDALETAAGGLILVGMSGYDVYTDNGLTRIGSATKLSDAKEIAESQGVSTELVNLDGLLLARDNNTKKGSKK